VKRVALKQFAMKPGEGLCTDMPRRAQGLLPRPRPPASTSTSGTGSAWSRLRIATSNTSSRRCAPSGASCACEAHAHELFPQLADARYPDLPEEITFLHAEDLLARFPDMPRKQRETRILQDYPAVFIIGIGWKLDDGYPHEMRAADTTTGPRRRYPTTAARCTA